MHDKYDDKKLKAIVLNKKQTENSFRSVLSEKFETIEWVNQEKKTLKIPSAQADILFIYSDHFSPAEITNLLPNLKNNRSECVLVKNISEKTFEYKLLKFNIVSEFRSSESLNTILKDVITRNRLKKIIDQKESFSFQNSHPLANSIAVQKMDGLEFIQIRNIECVQAWEKYSLLYCKDGSKHVATHSIKELEQVLTGHLFIQSHKSHLIHVPSIRAIKKNNVIDMISGRQIPLARRRRKDFIDWVLENRPNFEIEEKYYR